MGNDHDPKVQDSGNQDSGSLGWDEPTVHCHIQILMESLQ